MKLFESFESKKTEFDPRKHPEIEEGEMFLTNVPKNKDSLDRIGYTSKRVGETAYDIESGLETPDFVPVFISIKEYEEFKKKLNRERGVKE